MGVEAEAEAVEDLEVVAAAAVSGAAWTAVIVADEVEVVVVAVVVEARVAAGEARNGAAASTWLNERHPENIRRKQTTQARTQMRRTESSKQSESMMKTEG